MVKILVASFSRSSSGALSKLISKMKNENIWTDDYNLADYILVPGDRTETFDFALKSFRDNKKLIHLWAGDIDKNWSTQDEVYRHSLTLMSSIQLCTTDEAKKRVKSLCMVVGKQYCTVTIGNIMLDNLEIDESLVPEESYNLVLINPITKIGNTLDDIDEVLDFIKIDKKKYFWIEPNIDKDRELILPYVTTNTLPRPQFLGLLKNCDYYLTNSSSQFYEAQFLLKSEQIIQIGDRNKERRNRFENMSIPNASENVMKILRSLK